MAAVAAQPAVVGEPGVGEQPLAPVDGREDGTWPQQILEKSWELGLMNSHIPEEYGGPGVSTFEGALIEEELAWGCSGIATSIVSRRRDRIVQ